MPNLRILLPVVEAASQAEEAEVEVEAASPEAAS